MGKINIDFNEIPKYPSRFSLRNRFARLAWLIGCWLLFKPFALPFFNKWRIFILKCFGAKIGKGSIVYSSATIWAPWNLEIGKRVCIGPKVNCYNPVPIKIGNKVTVSQSTYLCGGGHDITSIILPFISSPIIIKDYAWICANCFIKMGVTIGEGAIVGATSSVFKDVDDWTVVGGNPAKYIKDRIINNNQ